MFETILANTTEWPPKAGANSLLTPPSVFSSQVYVIQDNVQLYLKDEYDSLQDTKYYEVDGPSYRMYVEPSNRHNGEERGGG